MTLEPLCVDGRTAGPPALEIEVLFALLRIQYPLRGTASASSPPRGARTRTADSTAVHQSSSAHRKIGPALRADSVNYAFSILTRTLIIGPTNKMGLCLTTVFAIGSQLAASSYCGGHSQIVSIGTFVNFDNLRARYSEHLRDFRSTLLKWDSVTPSCFASRA